MRMSLQTARSLHSISHFNEGKLPDAVDYRVEQAYNMRTIQGARALCMEYDIGSIAVGKKADLVIFDAMSPAMYGVTQKDPVGAIVLQSNIGDIDTVIVDGIARKRDGKLLPVKKVEWQEKGDLVETKDFLTWGGIARRVLDIQQKFVENLAGYELGKLGDAAAALFRLK
ncbi:Fc.00g096670.m01.CDS01 [Cosmosporella sp. VM-42]